MNMDVIFDYIRLVSYAVVVLTSLRNILTRKFTNSLFLGDIAVATALILMRFVGIYNFIDLSDGQITDFILTPAVVFWALIHFLSMWKFFKRM